MKFEIRTSRKVELIDITGRIEQAIHEAGGGQGLCVVTVPHTTAGVTINENADPAVGRDLISALDRMVPCDASYRHMEGNSPAHVKASLMGASALLFYTREGLSLGRWQGVFLCEFDGPRTRQIWINMMEQPC